MIIKLDNMPLNYQNQPGEDPDIRTITKITTMDKRTMVEHGIPGMEGNPFLNMGRNPVRIAIEGSLHGRSAKENIELLRSRYRQGVPVSFMSDITGAADITRVLIKEFKVEEKAGVPEIFWYKADIVEYKDPPLEPVLPPAGDAEAETWMDQTATDSADSLNCITGKILTSTGDPAQGVEVIITGPLGEYSVTTDDEGRYKKDDVPPGNYTITVADDEYTGISKEIAVGSSPTPVPEGGTEEGSIEDTAGEESTGDTAGEESTEDTAGEESTGDTADEESTEDTAGEESTEDTAGEESTGDTAGEENTGDTAGEENTGDTAGEEITEDSAGEVSTGDTAGEVEEDEP